MKPDAAKNLKNLKKFREEKGITQEQMAKVIGYSVSGYRKLEQGERKIKMVYAIQIANYLNCSLDEIFLSS